MPRTDLLSRPMPHRDRLRHRRAFYASCAFHGLILSLVLTLTYFYRAHHPPLQSGSAPGAPTLTLATLVVTAPPEPPTPPAPITPTPPPSVTPPQPPPKPPPPPPPDAAVPVLAAQPPPPEPAQPIQATSVKSVAITHSTLSHLSPAGASATTAHAKPASAPARARDAPGRHPDEARSLHQTGTVLMNVQFDSSGSVADAEVAQSSGVKVLDSCTRSFIRAHWHSPEYAGQTISVPVQYTLENL